MLDVLAIFISIDVTLLVIAAWGKLDFVTFRTQLLRCLSIYWFKFAYRTRHMQDEVKNTIDVFFFVNEGRVRSGWRDGIRPTRFQVSHLRSISHFIYRTFNHLYTGILDNLSQVSMFSKARWAILGYPDDPVVDKNLPEHPTFTELGSGKNVLVLEDYVGKCWQNLGTLLKTMASSLLLTREGSYSLRGWPRVVGRFKSVSYVTAKSLVWTNADRCHDVCHSPSLLIPKIRIS